MIVHYKARSFEIRRSLTRCSIGLQTTSYTRLVKTLQASWREASGGPQEAQMTATQIRSLGLWWLRRDLRTVDNEALTGGCRHTDALLPVYCFDPRDVQPRRLPPEGLGVPKLGPHRCRFLLEGLVEVRREIRQLQVAAAGPAAAAAAAQPPSLPPSASAWSSAVDVELSAVRDAGGGSAASVEPGSNREVANEAVAGGSIGRGGGTGGGLVVRFGQPEAVLPELLTRVVERNPQLCHVSLHHHMDVLEESVQLERAVAGALRQWGDRRGVSISVHTYWDRTLYHPDDLPYHIYDKVSKAPSQESSSWEQRGRRAGTSQPQQQHAGCGSQPLSPALQPNADRGRFRNIPPVMTDFRKTTQSAASVRPSLPAPAALPPLPPPFNGALATSTSTSTSTSAAAFVTAATDDEHAEAAAAADASLLGEIPRTVGEVYDAAGAQGALRRLEELVGLDFSGLLPPRGPDGPPASVDPRTAFPFRPGHDSAWRRLRYYVWGHSDGSGARADPIWDGEGGEGGGSAGAQQPRPQQPALQTCPPPSLMYFTNTRAQAVGVDNSTKLSPFVALGCITPRQIHEEVERVRTAAAAAAAAASSRARRGSAAGDPDGAAGSAGGTAAGQADGGGGGGAVPPAAECDWLALHLCIRDFFIYTVLKEGDAVLDERGIMGRPVSWQRDLEAFKSWSRGATGLPFVDANMRELAATGWMSNRGRQNVASMVTKDMGLDWRWGAELFESLLLDCDVAVNFCNWNYFAGIGNDPRNRHFKTVTQGMKYDEDAVLAATWLPELAHLPPALRHQPWTMTAAEAEQYGVVLGRDYPAPIVDPAAHVGQLTGTGKPKQRNKPAKVKT